jgi:virulence-associated protein VagC
MLAKLTVKNQLTLPKAVVSRFKNVQYFDVTSEGESIILRPLRESQASCVRDRLASLGITEEDVEPAVDWARKSSGQPE